MNNLTFTQQVAPIGETIVFLTAQGIIEGTIIAYGFASHTNTIYNLDVRMIDSYIVKIKNAKKFVIDAVETIHAPDFESLIDKLESMFYKNKPKPVYRQPDSLKTIYTSIVDSDQGIARRTTYLCSDGEFYTTVIEDILMGDGLLDEDYLRHWFVVDHPEFQGTSLKECEDALFENLGCEICRIIESSNGKSFSIQDRECKDSGFIFTSLDKAKDAATIVFEVVIEECLQQQTDSEPKFDSGLERVIDVNWGKAFLPQQPERQAESEYAIIPDAELMEDIGRDGATSLLNDSTIYITELGSKFRILEYRKSGINGFGLCEYDINNPFNITLLRKWDYSIEGLEKWLDENNTIKYTIQKYGMGFYIQRGTSSDLIDGVGYQYQLTAVNVAMEYISAKSDFPKIEIPLINPDSLDEVYICQDNKAYFIDHIYKGDAGTKEHWQIKSYPDNSIITLNQQDDISLIEHQHSRFASKSKAVFDLHTYLNILLEVRKPRIWRKNSKWNCFKYDTNETVGDFGFPELSQTVDFGIRTIKGATPWSGNL